VTPEIAYREMGYPAPAARAMWKAASVQGTGKPLRPAKDLAAQVLYQALAPLQYGPSAVASSPIGDHRLDGTDPLGFLAAGEPLTRIRWEQVVGDALSQDVFRWDNIPLQPNSR
jgi:hypothetical protein